jgi:hypothetical protein
MACTNNNDADIQIVVSDTDNAVDIVVSQSALIPISAQDAETLKHFIYNPVTDKLEADRAIETTLNSLFLGEQHKMSSGAENIFFTNLGNETNFFPLWAGLKDQSLITNQGASGYIAPSARVYEDMFSLPLGGNTTLNSTGYSGPNYFGVNIAGLGITTTAGEDVDVGISLIYYLSINNRRVYKQILPTTEKIFSGDIIEWMFDHPVEIHAGTTIFAEIRKVDRQTEEDFGVFQVRQGDEIQADGNYRYQAIVHNRLFVDKPVELISPYSKYKAMDFGLDSTGSTILLRDLSLGSDSLLVPHAVNTLEAIANGTEIKIKVKGGAKIIVESLPVSAISIDGSFVNSVLNQAVVQLNEVFTNTSGFASDDTFVNSFTLSGNDLTLGINDGTSYTVDVTTLGVDENNFVASGSLSGSDLTLTMADATTVVIDASGLAVDSNDVVESGVINGNDLELTLSNSSVITIDVSSLNVDTTLYVESGVLSGTDIILTMSDTSTITIDASTLAIDENTTITGGEVSGTDILLDVSDGSTLTIDASTLGGSGSSGNPVVSGSVIGTDLVLVLDDATQITIDASNMINGSSGLASSSGWHISYGANANDSVNTSINDSTVYSQLPFYFGQALEQGSEFKWNFQSHGGSNLILGIWDGAESPIQYNQGANTASNWGTMFLYAGGFTDGSNSTLLTTNSGSKYVVSNGGAMGIRFGNDGHLTLIDYSGTNEVAVAKTTIALSVTEFNIQMYTWANGVLPNGIINNVDYIWDIVHDFANTEAGIINGILDHTVLKSAISIEKGEKLMFMLDEVGQGDYFGTNYTAASSGVSTAEEQLDNEFKYETNEAMSFEFGGTSDWNVNTNATYYFDNGAGVVGYRKGGASTIQGMFSMRFNADGKLTIYSEDNNEKVATAKSDPAVGSSVHLYYGVKGNRAYYSIPVISKQTIGGGSQPDVNFVPTVADQTASVEEGDVLNFQIVSSDNIVNQFVEVDAPSWMSLDQNSGILSGTAPAFLGTSADTIVVNCKAGNAIGGTVDFTVTVSVTELAYTNSKSLNLDQSTNWLQGNPVNINSLERATNGDGNEWTISMWVKPNSNTSNQTLLVYGAGDDYNGGAITVKQSGGTTLVLNYGTVYDNIILVAGNSFVANTWQHVMITFDGGTTGVDPSSSSDYYSRFNIYIDGVLKSNIGVASGGGYDGAISGANPSDNIFRIGRASNVHNNYYGGVINQVAIWGSDESANVSTIYNSGATQDLSLLSTAPDHYYEIETSVTTVTDIEGSADLTGYNFSNTDLVTDTP